LISWSFLNLNILLVLVIITGAIAVLTQKETPQKPSKTTKKDYVLILLLGIVGAGIIFYKTRDI